MPFFALSPRPALAVTKSLIAASGPPASIRPLVVIGYASLGALATPEPYSSINTLVADKGVGSAVEAAAFALSPYGGVSTVHVVNAGGANAGSYGTITEEFANANPPAIVGDSVVLPGDSLEVVVKFTVGGTIGTTGIKYRFSTDNGFTFAAERELGTATTITLPWGAGKYVLNPPTGALVAIATEIRANLLDHFADAVAHNAADVTAAAAITLAAPTDNAEAFAVLNECRAAWVLHIANDTAHNSKDLVNVVSAPAATDEQTGAVLAASLSDAISPHVVATYPAAAASLKVATVTSVAVQTYNAAALIAAGITQLNNYPSKITFTTAGGTPADSPASVTIAGTNAATGLADTEVVTLGNIAGTDTSTKKWLGTGLVITYGAGDGVGATISIGTTAAAHNSADNANIITEADPERGTIEVDDQFYLETTGPSPDATQLVAAVRALRGYPFDFGVILFASPVTGAVLNTVAAELEALWGYGKFRSGIFASRLPNAGESYTDYKAAMNASFGAYNSTESRLVGGGVRAYSPIQLTADGSARPLRPPAWWVAAARARSTPETCLQRLPAARGVELKTSTGATHPRCYDEQETQWSVEVRMIGMRTNPQKDPSGLGVFITQDLLLYAGDSPWALGPYADVANHFAETIQRAIIDTIGNGYQSPPGEPLIEEVRNSIQEGVQAQAEAELVKKGRATEVQVQLANDAGLNGSISWTGTIVPLTYIVNGATLEIALSAVSISGAVQL